MTDDPQELPPTSEGTHPVALLGLAGGVASLVISGCFCFYPPVALLTQAIVSVLALGASVYTLVQTSRGVFHESNRFQGRLGALLSGIGLLIAIAMYFVFQSYGGAPGIG